MHFFSLYSQTGKLLRENDKDVGHKKYITSLAKSTDGSHFLTGSLDKSAKVIWPCSYIFIHCYYRSSLHTCLPIIMLLQLWDSRSLTLIKTYASERTVNAVAMSPHLNHVSSNPWHFHGFGNFHPGHQGNLIGTCVYRCCSDVVLMGMHHLLPIGVLRNLYPNFMTRLSIDILFP